MTTWTDDCVTLLRKLHAERLSFSKIAERIGGRSRNSAIGKAHRLGLKARKEKEWFQTRCSKPNPPKPPKPSRHRLKSNFARNPPPSSQRALAVEASRKSLPMDASLHLTLAELKSGQCRFPYGNGPYSFCALPICQDSPYCAHHHKVCHQPQREFSSYMRLEAIL